MLPSANLIVRTNSARVPPLEHSLLRAQIPKPRIPFPSLPSKVSPFACGIVRRHYDGNTSISMSSKPRSLQVCRSFTKNEKPDDAVLKEESPLRSDGEGGRDWTTSVLLFLLWGGIMYYVFNLASNQTPSRDMYFLQKLLNLKGDDGFRMNGVLVSLWNIMGLWPLVYSMLLLPTGRSSKGSVPVWPFTVLSFFGGIYALIPYFVLWKPPPPPVEEAELSRWPLNFLESKLTAGIVFLAGLGLITYAAFAGGDDWREFFQYFRESKFIHVTSLDFTLLSAFAPFWVYNDMISRKWYEKGSWLLPLSAVPFLGPALYLILRPAVKTVALLSSTSEQK
ncbi:uncharacterized protein LOC115688833 isoform X2 [Syzygium oleosum]|uniref:uncharacterized protein LOC115688833 isoform X2 n=1 Tax=Syzygium oleosum TaxID=219896 RepID=UPI0024BB5421|nr:uncharacterized protein LOC115688833 isoform X2 [Syzygium oleosum]